jgi:hypothetical protein
MPKKRKIVRLTPVSPATWLLLVRGLLGGVSMHLWPDMCPCQEERDARHVAATMEEVAAAMEELLSDLDALITLDYLYACAQVIIHEVARLQFRVQCCALVPAWCCASI